jgi:putative ABC transport system permease protein
MRSEGSHQYLVYLSDGGELDAVQARLAAVAQAEGFELRDWWSLAEFYRRAEQLFRQQLTVVVAIVTAILLLSISNTMMMTVLERTREIGTVMALGARPSRVLRGFVLEGAMLGLLGVLLGITLAWVLSLGLDALALQMPPPPGFSVGYTASIELGPPLLLRVALLSWGATVLACLWPAWRASRLEIVDALRVVR